MTSEQTRKAIERNHSKIQLALLLASTVIWCLLFWVWQDQPERFSASASSTPAVEEEILEIED